MSGLAALFHRDGRPADAAPVQAMLAAIPYRGPDGAWTRCSESVALGYAKMTVTPEEVEERQPLISPRTGCIIAADVRLDNRAELLARLPDRPETQASDADLILRAYETWGAGAFEHFLGDFAVVIWDPGRRRLVCARDTNAGSTLYYRVDPRTFAAASEIHQLFQDPSVPVVPNEDRIRDFLIPGDRNEPDGPSTFYAGIFAVPAGHVLVVDSTEMAVRRYWDLRPPKEIRYRHGEEYVEHFRELFFKAVHARLRSVGPVGALLSGGIDSPSIVCTAQELYQSGRADNRGFTTFSMLYDGLECDERVLIGDVVGKYGFAARYLSATNSIVHLQLDPSRFLSSPQRAVSEIDVGLDAAGREGVRVMLTGEVGDTCLTGSPYVFDSLLRRGRFHEAWRRLRSYRQVSPESWRRLLAIYGLIPFLPLRLQRPFMVSYARRRFGHDRQNLLPLWMPDTLREDVLDRYLRRELYTERHRQFSSPARHDDFRRLYPPESAYNPAGRPMQFRRPYADRRLHEFLLAIPPEQKFAPHQDVAIPYAGSKIIMRRAMRGILPESVRTQTRKAFFTSLHTDECNRNWPAYAATFGPSGRSEAIARGFADRALFWRRLELFRDGVWWGDTNYVLSVIWLETWFRSLGLPRRQLVAAPYPPDQARPGVGSTLAS